MSIDKTLEIHSVDEATAAVEAVESFVLHTQRGVCKKETYIAIGSALASAKWNIAKCCRD